VPGCSLALEADDVNSSGFLGERAGFYVTGRVLSLAVIVIAVAVGTVVAWIPTIFLAPQIAEATSAENLRTA
jgi:large-conductance mechanosensitive channel